MARRKPELTIETIGRNLPFYSLDDRSFKALAALHGAATSRYGLEPVYETEEVDEYSQALKITYRVPGHDPKAGTHPNLARWEDMVTQYAANTPNIKVRFNKSHTLNHQHLTAVLDTLERYATTFDQYVNRFPAPLMLEGMDSPAAGKSVA